MQQAFGFNLLALVDGQPQLLPLKRQLAEFLGYYARMDDQFLPEEVRFLRCASSTHV